MKWKGFHPYLSPQKNSIPLEKIWINDYAIKLIQNGNLETNSIESIAKNSNFQAEVTIYRVFKKINIDLLKNIIIQLNLYRGIGIIRMYCL